MVNHDAQCRFPCPIAFAHEVNMALMSEWNRRGQGSELYDCLTHSFHSFHSNGQQYFSGIFTSFFYILKSVHHYVLPLQHIQSEPSHHVRFTSDHGATASSYRHWYGTACCLSKCCHSRCGGYSSSSQQCIFSLRFVRQRTNIQPYNTLWRRFVQEHAKFVAQTRRLPSAYARWR